jgi:hypothetical protein
MQETRAMGWEVGMEFIDMTEYVKNMSNLCFMCKLEVSAVGKMVTRKALESFELFSFQEVSTEREGGREPSDPAFNLVTKSFHGLVAEWNRDRSVQLKMREISLKILFLL